MPNRPNHHFTPPNNWMNDPNGLIYHMGLFHMYYQHNPSEPNFGNICWGHATSKDLVSWKHQPTALNASKEVMMYSGCTIVDEENVLGQEKPCLAAIYTEHVGGEEGYYEQVCLAISEDDGFSFDQENRTIILKSDDPDFRDPKVFYHRPSKKWKLVIAKPKQYVIGIYESVDLIHWAELSEFTHATPHEKFWECPDLFPLSCAEGKEQWVLSISGVNVDKRSWGMFYFLGDFDGKKFEATSGPLWLDQGKDFYAGITIENYLQEKVMIAWCGNWAYANDQHEDSWKGIMSSPRSLTLDEERLRHKLISEIEPIVHEPSTPYQSAKTRTRLRYDSGHWHVHRFWMGREEAFPMHTKGKLYIYEDECLVEIIDDVGNSTTFLSDPLR